MENNNLIVTLPLIDPPKLSKSGKTLLAATDHLEVTKKLGGGGRET